MELLLDGRDWQLMHLMPSEWAWRKAWEESWEPRNTPPVGDWLAGTVPGDAWSDFLPGSRDTEADWVTLKCGNYNTKTKTCSGQNYK